MLDFIIFQNLTSNSTNDKKYQGVSEKYGWTESYIREAEKERDRERNIHSKRERQILTERDRDTQIHRYTEKQRKERHGEKRDTEIQKQREV